MKHKKYSRIIARITKVGENCQAIPLFGKARGISGHLKFPCQGIQVGAIVQLTLVEDGDSENLLVSDCTRLAEAGGARASLFGALSRLKINPVYSEDVMNEVMALLREPGIDDPSLVDLTHVPFVTIDNRDSRDLDQALHISSRLPHEGPGFVVRYALADAAFFVRPQSALFDEAINRGVSYYLPGWSVPMLPPDLSEGLVSLNPGVERRALVFIMTLDGQGLALETKLVRARICSRAKLTYPGVQRFYDNMQSSPLNGRLFTRSLQLLKEVGEQRIAEAARRDVVSFDQGNLEIEMEDLDRERFVFTLDERNDTSRYNEQISLLCNMEGANLLSEISSSDAEVQAVYKVHQAPTSSSLVRLYEIISSIVDMHDLDPKVWRWRRKNSDIEQGESLADYLQRLPREEPMWRIRAAVERQILVSNQRSWFSSEPGLHYGLGVEQYSRFSSPMREVIGIFTHKEALEKLGLGQSRSSSEQDLELREQVLKSANRARERQRQLTSAVTKLAVDQLLRDDLKRPLEQRRKYVGTILGLKASRLYVCLDRPPVELKVYVEDLEEQAGLRLALRESGVEIGPDGSSEDPRFRVGDEIALKTLGFDEARERWKLGLAERSKGS